MNYRVQVDIISFLSGAFSIEVLPHGVVRVNSNKTRKTVNEIEINNWPKEKRDIVFFEDDKNLIFMFRNDPTKEGFRVGEYNKVIDHIEIMIFVNKTDFRSYHIPFRGAFLAYASPNKDPKGGSLSGFGVNLENGKIRIREVYTPYHEVCELIGLPDGINAVSMYIHELKSFDTYDFVLVYGHEDKVSTRPVGCYVNDKEEVVLYGDKGKDTVLDVKYPGQFSDVDTYIDCRNVDKKLLSNFFNTNGNDTVCDYRHVVSRAKTINYKD